MPNRSNTESYFYGYRLFATQVPSGWQPSVMGPDLQPVITDRLILQLREQAEAEICAERECRFNAETHGVFIPESIKPVWKVVVDAEPIGQ